jgi:thioredoxin-related protein
MKSILLVILAAFSLSHVSFAGDKQKKTASAGNEINWVTLDELQVKMKKAPRKIYFDIYTDWCGWCKVMDKKTFTNPQVIKYMNEKFYAVKLNAERQDSIRFVGKMFGYVPDYKANMLAVELMGGRMSYPTTVILDENYQNPQPIPGYLDVPTIEKILKYLGENIYKTQKYEEYDKAFQASWAASN